MQDTGAEHVADWGAGPPPEKPAETNSSSRRNCKSDVSSSSISGLAHWLEVQGRTASDMRSIYGCLGMRFETSVFFSAREHKLIDYIF